MRYAFGTKVSLATTLEDGFVVGARSFPGNPYDGHTLAAALEQVEILAACSKSFDDRQTKRLLLTLLGRACTIPRFPRTCRVKQVFLVSVKMVPRTAIAIASIILSPGIAFSGPKEDCTLAVEYLGFPTSRYSFVAAGIIAKERHVFDDVVNCYISSDGKKIHSITRGKTVLMEEGYYGPEALAKKIEVEAQGRAADQAAYKAYQKASKQIAQNTERDLDALRRSSDPFVNGGVKATQLAATPDPEPAIPTTPVPAAGEATPKLEFVATPVVVPKPEPVPTLVIKPEPVAEPAPEPIAAPITIREKWSTAERLTIRTCPSTQCGVTGWMIDGDKVKVYEEKNGWSRIDEPQSAMCTGGKSGMVDSGNSACTPANGIVDGRLARWVSSEYLADDKPEAPKSAQGCSGLGLEDSDNARKYPKQFCTAALKMINDGTCQPSDFQGLPWSASPARGEDYYFVYCGGIQRHNRWYLNIRTGAVTH